MVVLLMLAGGIAFAVAGCATQASTQSGFLRDYSNLQATGEASGPLAARVALQRADTRVLGRYQAVYIEPVAVTAEGLDAEQTTMVSDILGKALAEEVGKSWPLAAAPGRGVLRVRTAVTGVTKSNVPLNIALTLVATAVSNGGAAGEAEIVDAVTGRRVAALTWADEKRFSGPLGYFAETGHARALLPEFAAQVAKAIAR